MPLCSCPQLWALHDVGEAVNHLSTEGATLCQCCHALLLTGTLRRGLMQEKDPRLFPSHQGEQGYVSVPLSSFLWLQTGSTVASCVWRSESSSHLFKSISSSFLLIKPVSGARNKDAGRIATGFTTEHNVQVFVLKVRIIWLRPDFYFAVKRQHQVKRAWREGRIMEAYAAWNCVYLNEQAWSFKTDRGRRSFHWFGKSSPWAVLLKHSLIECYLMRAMRISNSILFLTG